MKVNIRLFTRAPGLVSNQIQTSPLLLIVTPDNFVTISKDPLEVISKFQNSPSLVSTTQKTKFFLMFLLDINSAYSHQINDIRKKVRLFTSDIQNITNQNIIQLVDFQSIFNDLLSSLEPLSLTFNQLLSGKYLQLYEADQDLAEDLKIGTDQLVQLCRSNIKAISNIREAYASIISNNLNRTVKFLTAVTLILTIPTAIASFFGMNVGLPLADHPLAFGVILIGTLLITVFVWLFLWKNDFL